MALEMRRRLAIPVWAIAFFAVSLTAPPTATLFLMPLTTVFALAAVAIGAILFLTPGAMAWLPASPSLVRVGPAGYRDPALAAGTSVSKLDGPTTTEADDASRLDRMDDDGGWQMTQFPG